MHDDRQYSNRSAEEPIKEGFRSIIRFPWIRLALALILIGAVLHGMGRISGASGLYNRWNNVFHHSIDVRHYNWADVWEEYWEHVWEDTWIDAWDDNVLGVWTDDGIWNIPDLEFDYLHIEAFTSADISTTSTNIAVSVGSSDQFRIEHSPRGRINIRRHNGRLSIQSRGGRGTLRIYVPSHAGPYDLNLSSTSGRIHVEDITWYDLNISTTSGTIRVDGHPRNLTTLQSISGSINAEIRSENTPAYILSSVSGPIHVNGGRASNPAFNSMEAHQIIAGTISGSIRLYTTAD